MYDIIYIYLISILIYIRKKDFSVNLIFIHKVKQEFFCN